MEVPSWKEPAVDAAALLDDVEDNDASSSFAEDRDNDD